LANCTSAVVSLPDGILFANDNVLLHRKQVPTRLQLSPLRKYSGALKSNAKANKQTTARQAVDEGFLTWVNMGPPEGLFLLYRAGTKKKKARTVLPGPDEFCVLSAN